VVYITTKRELAAMCRDVRLIDCGGLHGDALAWSPSPIRLSRLRNHPLACGTHYLKTNMRTVS